MQSKGFLLMFAKHKYKIAQHFNRAVGSYDQAADLQYQVGIQLLKNLNKLNLKPQYALDVGIGTGLLAERFLQCFDSLSLTGVDIAEKMLLLSQQRLSPYSANMVCADFDELPFFSKSFDLIYSNMSIQWSFNLNKTLAAFVNCLKKGGCIGLTLLVDGTLKELNASCCQALNRAMVNPFHSHQALLVNFVKHRVRVLHQQNTHVKKTFLSISELLKYLRRTGANYSIRCEKKAAISKKDWYRLQDYYKKYFYRNGRYEATFSVSTVIGQRI